MIVMKFGGAVLREPDGFRRMARILGLNASGPVLVVISAFATATRDLEFAARMAQRGLLAESSERLDHLISDHITLVRALLPDATSRTAIEALLHETRGLLHMLLEGICTTRQLTAKTLDRILAYGEFLALHIARHVLADSGLDVTSVDAQNLIVTTDDHGAARPLSDKSSIRVMHTLLPALESHSIVLVQGFVGRSEDGATTTMGKESSNLTATFLASLIDAREVVIWTDVEGVRSADPHLMDATAPRPHLSYHEARTAAHEGLKLLYPTMIEPAELAGIPIRIASALKPDGECTIIDGKPGSSRPIVIVQTSESHCSISTVCVNVPSWLNAISRVLTDVQDIPLCDVSSNSEMRTAIIRVPETYSQNIARLLHKEISILST